MTPPEQRTGPTRPPVESAAGSRRRLILVCGPGGAGKTTLADLLSRELNVACLHKDDIKASLHDAGITTTLSFQIFQSLAEKQLSNRIDLIIEATMHVPDDWDIFRRWQETYDLDLICVICSVDRDERERRIKARARHPAHAEADERQLAELDLVVDYSRLPGLHIDLSTQEDPLTSMRTVLKQLR